MPKQDIQDGGSIIGYRPKLKYEKEGFQNTDVLSKESKQNITLPTKYTNTLQEFINTCPSSTVKRLIGTSEYMQKLIEKLSDAFPNSTYDKYGSITAYLMSLESDNDEFSMEFLNHHKYDVNGSQIPELIHCIYCNKKRIEQIYGTIKQLYYGNSTMDMLSANEIDDAYIAKLRAYENSNNSHKVNYYALSIDTSLNTIITMHSVGITRLVMKVSNIMNLSDTTSIPSTNMELIKSLLAETNSELDSRLFTYNTQQNSDLITKALQNYYQKRKDALSIYSLINNKNSSSILDAKLSQKQQDVQDALGNVNRVLKATELYTKEFSRLEQEKHFLKDIYSSFSYISEN